MLTILPTADYFDRLISLTHRFTQVGISKITPGVITPASKLWIDFSYAPIQFVLNVIKQLEGEDESDDTALPTPEAPHPSIDRYFHLKAQHPDELVFIRVGDFCETFCDDAKIAAKELELVMTGKGSGERQVPMAGVPHHAFKRYEAKLTQMGFTVRYFDPNNPESIDLPESDSDSTDGIEPSASVAPPETGNAKGQESIFSPVPSPITSPVTDDKPQPKDIEEFEIEVDGIPILVTYKPNWSKQMRMVHFEFHSTHNPRQPIPCSETGYHSHFFTAQAVLEYGTPEAYATAYVELNRIKAFKPTKSTTDEGTPETEEQMTLTLEGINGQQPPHIEPTGLRRLVPLAIGDVVEIADTLSPKHADRDAVGKWGKILKFTDEDETYAIIQLIETGKRCTIPAVCLHRLQLPQLQTLGTSRTLAYATINGELHAWIGFKTKKLYSDWCCRKKDRSAYIKDLDEPKRSLYLRDKWECAIIKPTMKKLHKLAQYNFSQEPGVFFYEQRKAKQASLPQTATRQVLPPGTLVEITAESDRNIQGRVGTVILDYLKDDVMDGIVVKLGKNSQECLMNGEFRVVDTEPQEEFPIAEQPLAA